MQVHVMTNSIEWVWPRSQVVNGRSLGAKAWQKTTLAWFYSIVSAAFFLSCLDYLKYSPHKPALHDTTFVDSTMRYQSEISKSHPRIRAALD